MLLQFAELARQRGQRLADGCRLQFDALLLARIGSQGRWNHDFHWHSLVSIHELQYFELLAALHQAPAFAPTSMRVIRCWQTTQRFRLLRDRRRRDRHANARTWYRAARPF